jgi:large subunit ribosomal protein L47
LSSFNNDYFLTMFQCRKSMARIKAVINERRLAYEGAVKIAEQQKDEHFDRELLQLQTAQFRTERKRLRRRRECKAWKETEKMEEAREVTTQGASAEIAMVQEAMAQEAAQDAVPQFVTTPLATAPRSVSDSVVDPSPTGRTRTGSPDADLQQPGVGSVENTKSEIPTATQPKGVDAATAGLFGDVQTSGKVGKPRL